MSWSYNPMLTVEVSEIGTTLIALSVPGIKPLFDKFVLRRAPPTSSSESGFNSGDGRSRKNTLRRTGHSVLSSSDNIRGELSQFELEPARGSDTRTNSSTEGILVRVDVDMKKDRGDVQDYIRNQYGKF